MDQKNYYDSQNPLNNIDFNKIIAVRDQLMTLPWSEIKENRNVLEEALSDEPINAASMVLLRRTFLFSQLFKNSQLIPPDIRAIDILNTLINFDLKRDKTELSSEMIKIVPGVILNDLAKLDQLQSDARNINNAFDNLLHIAFLKNAEEIFPAISYLKRKPQENINEYVTTINSIVSTLKTKLDNNIEPSKEDIDNAANFLKKLGHSNFEVEDLRNKYNNFTLFNIIQKNQEALEVIQVAYKNNLVNQLDNVETIAQILEQI